MIVRTNNRRQTVFGMSTEVSNETTRARGNIALVSLHAGYSHSSLALQSILAFSEHEPFFPAMRCFETLVNVNHQSLIEHLFAFKPCVIGFSTSTNSRAILPWGSTPLSSLRTCPRYVITNPCPRS